MASLVQLHHHSLKQESSLMFFEHFSTFWLKNWIFNLSVSKGNSRPGSRTNCTTLDGNGFLIQTPGITEPDLYPGHQSPDYTWPSASGCETTRLLTLSRSEGERPVAAGLGREISPHNRKLLDISFNTFPHAHPDPAHYRFCILLYFNIEKKFKISHQIHSWDLYSLQTLW